LEFNFGTKKANQRELVKPLSWFLNDYLEYHPTARTLVI